MVTRHEPTLESQLGDASDPQSLNAQATGTDRLDPPKPGRKESRDDPSETAVGRNDTDAKRP